MHAELKSLMSPDIDIESFSLDPSEKFNVFIQAFIGPSGSDGQDAFGLTVRGPADSSVAMGDKPYVWNSRALILNNFSGDLIETALADLCQKTLGEDWHDVATRLNEYLVWEFEGYRQYNE